MSILDRNSTITRKIVRLIWLTVFAALVGVCVLFFLVSRSDLPDLTELENPQYELATRIYASDGYELGRLYRYNRVYLDFDEISPKVVDALLATEDIRFYKHSGIDAKGTMRAVFFLGQRGGASTITQQLAKQLFTGAIASNIVQRIWQKLKEWYISIQLEKRYTKEEIIAMYLNKFDFIHGAVGVYAASEIYFGKDQSTLNIQEAASLIGMLKNPSLYNPIKQSSVARRNVVLHQMDKYDFLPKGQLDSLRELPLDVSSFERKNHSKGVAPYFRQELTKWVRRLLQDKKYYKPDGTPYNVYTDGIQIYTTLDHQMQVVAEEEMVKHMKSVQEKYFSRWKKDDPWTYEADTDYKKKIRQDKLKSLIAQSDRYKAMRQRSIGDLVTALETEYDAQLRDVDIRRMLAQEKDKMYFRKSIAKKLFSKKMAGNYERIMKSSDWETLKSQWEQLQIEVDKVFNEPVEMTVFTYDEDFRKKVTMTPLDSIKYHFEHLQFGSLSVEPSSGHVKTWVGGVNHEWFKYDHIQADRQVGSTFKPFVYSAAITMKGMSPCFQIKDIPYTIAPGDGNFQLLKPWTPANSDEEYTGEYYNMYQGLVESRNTVSVYLMKELGNTKLVRDLCQEMGIDSYKKRSNGSDRIPDAPSICLGAADLTVMEMAGAYTTFPNNGVYSEPIFVTHITDKNGRVIYRNIERENTVFSEAKNYVILDLLDKTADRYSGVNQLQSATGGKTGTTNDYVDGWYVGFSPDLVVATWVGGEAPWIRFKTITDGQGARMARPFYINFMKRLEENPSKYGIDPSRRFYKPSGDLGIELDCSKYKKLNPNKEEDPLESISEDEEELDNLFID